MKLYIGFDTSCYTTSIAIVDDMCNIIAAERRLLSVPDGSRGLRQQEMVFQHNAALPELAGKAFDSVDVKNLVAGIAASTRPRNVEGSYMPAFSVGAGYAKTLACALGVPFYETDHQSGHLTAALYKSDIADDYIAMHLSGGTTELLHVSEDTINLLGGTLDISLGQLIDRTGVALGLPFPAGPSLERVANEAFAAGNISSGSLKLSVKGYDCNISGAEAQVMRNIEGGMPSGHVAAMVFSYAAKTCASMLAEAVRNTKCSNAVLFGGVASSGLFRRLVADEALRIGLSIKIVFAIPELSGDNAVGVALIARRFE